MVTKEQQIRRCESNRDAWLDSSSSGILPAEQIVLSVPSINAALDRVRQLASSLDKVGGLRAVRHRKMCINAFQFQLDVLVTGSLHLVGGVLSLLDPELDFLLAEKENDCTDPP